MKIKEKLLNYIEQSQQVLEPLSINNNAIDLKDKLERCELIVPVVGGFSAGKSSLINSFLKTNLLPTAITPETALATELRYSDEEYIEAIDINEKTHRYSIEQLNEIKDNSKGFKFLRIFLNNQDLADIRPLVLVDMPGFDAPLEEHNQAIMQYLTKGCYFIFLTSVEDGSITRSMSREIKNISLFAKDFSFCLSKTDLRTEDDVQKIKSFIESQLHEQFNLSKNVVLTNLNGGQNLKVILESINPEELFKNLFIDDLHDYYFKNQESLNTLISALKTSKDESNDAIRALEYTLKDIERKKQNSIDEIESKYSIRNVDDIISSVSSYLIRQKDYLVNLAINDSDAFSLELNDIVRNTLISEVKQRIDIISNELIQDFKFSLITLANVQGFEFDKNFSDKMAGNIQNILRKTTNGLNELKEKMEKKDGAGKIYKTITTILGITTSIVNPIIEVALVFLPEIISLFSPSKKELEQRQKEQQCQHIESQLIGNILPQIKSKIRQELPSLLKEQISILVNQISDEFEKQIQQKQIEIQQAVEQKENFANELENRISTFENAKSQLSLLAKDVIF